MPCSAITRIRSAQSARSVVTMPPSPVVMFFTAWKLNAVRSLAAPMRRGPVAAPNACAASSTTTRPWRLAIPARRASGAGRPAKWTGSSAAVRGVTAASTAAGSRFSVVRSMSASTGVPPAWMIALMVAQNV